MIRSTTPLALLGTTTLILLAACGEKPEEQGAGTIPQEGTVTAAPTAAAPVDSVAPAAAPAAGALLDPNTATPEQLAAVPGLTAAHVDAIVAARPHATMLTVDRAIGAGLAKAQRDTVYGRLWKPIDLNTASKEEMLLIPGVGKRMQHEFEEYRPYKSIEQFRREIGKYVDDAEVARLEKYVSIR